MSVKTVVVTGAAHGIGNAIARLFAKDGYRVVINYNKSANESKKLETDLKNNGYDALAIQADVSENAAVQKMVEKSYKFLNHIDVLVNNAGIGLCKLFCETSVTDWTKVFSTNVFGIFNCCKHILPGMIKRKYGKIINISSVLGLNGAAMEVAYSSSKAAIIGFTKALAKEVGPCNINVNCVAPGVIYTKMNKNLSPSEMETLKNSTPIGKIGTPEDIARTALFLASDEANFITGQTISVDGGIII